MGVKAGRVELLEEILDESGGLVDREIAARMLVRKFPVRIQSFTDLVAMVVPAGKLSPELFDLLADAYENVRPAP